jgi:hypothetical protein
VFRDTEELLRPKRVDYCHAVHPLSVGLRGRQS